MNEKPTTQKRESAVVDIYSAKERVRKDLHGYYAERFDRGFPQEVIDDLKDVETPKTQEINELFVQLNQMVGRFVAQYGADPIFLTPDKMHMVDYAKLSERLKKLVGGKENVQGRFVAHFQRMLMTVPYKEGTKLYFAHILVHEMLHFNAYQADITIKEEFDKDDPSHLHVSVRNIRSGFHVQRPDRSVIFGNIDEAIIEELAIRFDEKYFSELPFLKVEYKGREGARDYLKKNGDTREVGLIIGQGSEKVGYNTIDVYRPTNFSYPKERKQLNELIDELFEKNRDQFQNREEVFMLFARGTMAGELKPIAQLIDKTFGRGSFKKLGEETAKRPAEKVDEEQI